jgi:phosphohistidine phosphatase
MGRWINRVAGPIDVAVLSPAARVEQTWALLGAELDQVGVVHVDSRIYEAWGVHLVDVIRELPEDFSTVLVVGHEPGVSELSLTLANGHNHVLRRRISHKYPTCGVAVLESTLPWSDFVPACAELVHFVAPKDM